MIYDELSTDTVFTSLIGTYEFVAGQTVPALSIVSPGQDLPALRGVSGVECIIQDVGDITSYDYITSDAARQSVAWCLFLVAWGDATGADVQVAAQRACSRFVGADSIQTVATADGLGASLQTKIIIRSDMPIRPI